MLCWFMAKRMTGTSLYKMLINFKKIITATPPSNRVLGTLENSQLEHCFHTAEHMNSKAKKHWLKRLQCGQKLLENTFKVIQLWVIFVLPPLAKKLLAKVQSAAVVNFNREVEIAAPSFLMMCFFFHWSHHVSVGFSWISNESLPLPSMITFNLFRRCSPPCISHSELQCCQS